MVKAIDFIGSFLLLLLTSCGRSSASSSSSSSTTCHVAEDFVYHLPGFNQPLPSAWYSGYLTYPFEGRTIHTHYTLVEAEQISNDDDDDVDEDETKPLIYWSNGGPGASSLFGLLTELGPLLLSDLSLRTEEFRSTGIPTPKYNPYAWTRLGSVLVFDQPAPIGFSYCNDDGKDSHSCDGIVWTDELTSANAYAALQAFYRKFPCYQQTPLYLTGESYAGIYIPTFAREILKHNNNHAEKTIVPLKGFAVGDGCLGIETDICIDLWSDPYSFDLWYLVFVAGHGQIPMSTFRDVMRACRPHHDHDHDDDKIHNQDSLDEWVAMLRGSSRNVDAENSPECKAQIQHVTKQLGGLYVYGLYDECTYRNGLLKQYGLNAVAEQQQQQQQYLDGGVNDYPCGGEIVMESYLQMAQVKEALHLEGTWFSVDNAEGGFQYTPTEPDLTGFYKEINNQGIQVLIYNGDADPAITSFAAQNWTSKLGFDVEQEWRPWTVDGCRRVGGYVTRYGGDFDFLTIRGAGHMVPNNKAAAAFTFLKSWIEGKEYPSYDKDCVAPQTMLPLIKNEKQEIKDA